MVYDHQDIIKLFPALYCLNSQILVLDLLKEQINNKNKKKALLKIQIDMAKAESRN
jgi:hypothetical protein